LFICSCLNVSANVLAAHQLLVCITWFQVSVLPAAVLHAKEFIFIPVCYMHQRLSATSSCQPPAAVSHQQLSATSSCQPPAAVSHQQLSATSSCQPSLLQISMYQSHRRLAVINSTHQRFQSHGCQSHTCAVSYTQSYTHGLSVTQQRLLVTPYMKAISHIPVSLVIQDQVANS
jgi:hypothetical protein